jgi:hypothetical protein
MHCFKCNTQAPGAHVAAVLLEAAAQQLPAAGTTANSAPTPVGSQEQAAILRSKQAVLDAAKKAGSGDAVIALLQADLDGKKAEFQAAKPISTQLKQAEAKHTAAVKELYSHREKVAAQKKLVEEAIAASLALEALEASVLVNLDEAKEVVDELRRHVAQGELDDGITKVDDPFAGMPKSWRLYLEARGDKTELLAGFSAAADLQRAQAVGDGTAASSQTSASGGENVAAAGSQDMEVEFAMPQFLNELFGDETADGLDPADVAWIRESKLRMEKRPTEEIRAAAARAAKRRKC